MARPWILEYDTANCTIGAAVGADGEGGHSAARAGRPKDRLRAGRPGRDLAGARGVHVSLDAQQAADHLVTGPLHALQRPDVLPARPEQPPFLGLEHPGVPVPVPGKHAAHVRPRSWGTPGATGGRAPPGRPRARPGPASPGMPKGPRACAPAPGRPPRAAPRAATPTARR